ncbi:MAG TPA: glycosyltransferase family 4 protein [Stellaceae bacterium]
MNPSVKRLAIVVSHPIQYFVPLYQRLALRPDIAIKVFYTWHAAQQPVEDRGFKQFVAWDIPLTAGYDFELVPNTSRDPGTHRFFGLRNAGLVERVLAWRPDAALICGWAWWSHLRALYALRRRGVCCLFRGDSHLLDADQSGPRWRLKYALLRRVFALPSGFLVVGSANRAYYERFGVDPARLYPCPHSIDIARFAEPESDFEQEASDWRRRLCIAPDRPVLLYAGKFEPRKRPAELMRIVQRLDPPNAVLILVGGGELQGEIDAIAASDPERFRVLPFQNQSRMPVVYRLADICVLPSAYGESWGMAVNEALACGRPVLVSDRVGCAADLVDADCGGIFPWNDEPAWQRVTEAMIGNREALLGMRTAAARRAVRFDISATEETLVDALAGACAGCRR